jgi:hypothetical protein
MGALLMDIKEIAGRMFHSFFVIFTGSVLAMYAYSLIFGESAVKLQNITALLVMTVLADLAYFIFYSRKELSRQQMLIRFGIHMVVITVIMLSVAGYMEWVSWDAPIQIILFTVLVIAVYVMVTAVSVYQSKKLADKLNEKLKERYK